MIPVMQYAGLFLTRRTDLTDSQSLFLASVVDGAIAKGHSVCLSVRLTHGWDSHIELYDRAKLLVCSCWMSYSSLGILSELMR